MNFNYNFFSCLIVCVLFLLLSCCCVSRFWCPTNLFIYLVKFCENFINILISTIINFYNNSLSCKLSKYVIHVGFYNVGLLILSIIFVLSLLILGYSLFDTTIVKNGLLCFHRELIPSMWPSSTASLPYTF